MLINEIAGKTLLIPPLLSPANRSSPQNLQNAEGRRDGARAICFVLSDMFWHTCFCQCQLCDAHGMEVPTTNNGACSPEQQG